MLIHFSWKLIRRKDSGNNELLCRDLNPVITRGRDPDPDERNDYFDFSLFFWHEIIVIDSQCSYISHGTELDEKFQVITNYCVVTRIPTNVTIISTLHSFFLARKHCTSTHNAQSFLMEVNWTERFR